MKIIINLLIIFSALPCQSQNLIDYWEYKKGDEKNSINLFLKDGSTITLKTRYAEKDIAHIDHFATEKYCMIVIEPANSNYQEYIINAAFKLENRWVQDYQDRSYFKVSTGISSVQIEDLELINEQTFKVEYRITSSFSESNSIISSEVKLGKYGFFENKTGMQSAITHYNDKYEMGKLQNKSTRTNYLGFK